MAAVLTTYRGIVRNGKIELEDAHLADGVEVVVVAQEKLPSVEEQIERFQAMSKEEWEKPFRDYFALAAREPPELDINSLSDEELVKLVDKARRR